MTGFNYQDPALQQVYDQATVSFAIPQGQVQEPPRQLSSASSYADLQYLFGVQDPTMLLPKPARNRKKSNQGSEHIKHRRTRSGCYTCRSRRVKCDEAHPICERCKKGGRDCLYPEKSISSKAAKGGSSKATQSASHEGLGSSTDEYDDDEDGPELLKPIADGEEEPGQSAETQESSVPTTQESSLNHPISGQIGSIRQSSETPSLIQDKGASPTPSTEGSVGYTTYQTIGPSRETQLSVASPFGSDSLRSDWSHLPPDLQFYLTYFYENVTHLHYSLKTDGNSNFLRTLFIDAALRNEALLYAVVGFSAFQLTLHNPEGKIQDFLQYYNKAVSMLLHSLKKGEKHSTGTLLAILQLATIEEFLGDWINLLGHQKAAFEILTELYTPQTVMQSELSRVILGWYMRFDVFAGLMGGFETVLSREWFSYSQDFYKQQLLREPEQLNWKIELCISQLRLVAMDMGTVFAKIGKGEIGPSQFAIENEVIGRRLQEWKTKMNPALQDSRYLVTDFTGARAVDPDDIVNPYLPGVIYSKPLFVMNVCLIDWYSIDLMHRYQTALTMQEQPGQELGVIAYKTCQLYEAIEYFPQSPPGTVLALQASLAIACLFLPRDEMHSMWARRKLAIIEANGYIYPYTFRTKMSDMFRDPSCRHWWLPNDEGYSPIIRSIRRFVEERTAPARDLPTEDLRDMKAIFSSLSLDNGDSNQGKGKGQAGNVVVASGQEDQGQGSWGDEQGGGIYGVPKHDDYQ